MHQVVVVCESHRIGWLVQRSAALRGAGTGREGRRAGESRAIPQTGRRVHGSVADREATHSRGPEQQGSDDSADGGAPARRRGGESEDREADSHDVRVRRDVRRRACANRRAVVGACSALQ